MIAARQMDFVGKLVHGPWDRPAKRILTACCNHKRLRGRPNYHNKDTLVKNLKLLFTKVDEVRIDDKGSLKDWIKEASHKQYWEQLVKCLLDKTSDIPERPSEWPRPRRSPRNHGNSATENTPPSPTRDNHQEIPPSPPPRPRQRRPRQRERENGGFDQTRDYIAENVGKFLYDSLKILGLGLGASETEVKVKYRELSRMYHPDKHDSTKTGLTDEQASDFFKLTKNAHSYLREVL